MFCPDASSDALSSAVIPVSSAIGAIHGEICSKLWLALEACDPA